MVLDLTDDFPPEYPTGERTGFDTLAQTKQTTPDHTCSASHERAAKGQNEDFYDLVNRTSKWTDTSFSMTGVDDTDALYWEDDGPSSCRVKIHLFNNRIAFKRPSDPSIREENYTLFGENGVTT